MDQPVFTCLNEEDQEASLVFKVEGFNLLGHNDIIRCTWSNVLELAGILL